MELLLVRWQEARLGEDAGVTGDVNVDKLIAALERAAFMAHHSQDTEAEGPSDISEAMFLSVLKDYVAGSWDEADRLAGYIKERAGLLLPQNRP